ncbi:phasin [Nitratireductor sp. CAU 1489]|uniref:Phasin n=1 Tax=Nitratireductor arenosus TaxID=2682096 RepID=A0A844QN30_9HYPH|nr:phasin [Nitratireductor arenosus]MVA99458.1 phasin [Nitratireductor arenosus]
MSKSAKTAETIEFPTFDAEKATDQLRSFAEKSLEQSKETYAKFKAGAEDAQKTLETSFETIKQAGDEVSLKAITAMRANAEAGFGHLEALVGAKTISEVVELQTSFVRKNVEMMVDQAKDMQAVSSKAVEDISKPVKTAFEKTMKDIKVA